MDKFVIACPKCGAYAEAKKGFFAKKKIECACGNIIDTRRIRPASAECPRCKNTVIFDQTIGEKAVCPVCGELVNSAARKSKTLEVSCARCGTPMLLSKEVVEEALDIKVSNDGREPPVYTCPVCACENVIADRAATEKIRREGLASIIKYEGDEDTLVWKHPMEDFNYGSQLIVHESQEALFFRDGQALDLFGAGRYTLETQQLPILEKLYDFPTDPERTFHSEVYYINLATVMGVKWGTDSKIRMFDPATGLHVEIGACGEFNIRVRDSRRLVTKLVGTTGSLDQSRINGVGTGRSFFRAMIMTQVKSCLGSSIKNCGINILEVDGRLLELSEALRESLNGYLKEYGLEMPEFFVTRVMTPDDDPNFRRMKQQYAEQYLLVKQEQIRKSEAEAAGQRKAAEAEAEARVKVIGAQAEADALRLQKEAEAEAYRMKAEAEAMEMKMKGYTYREETARQVGLSAAKAMSEGGGGAGSAGSAAVSGLKELAGLGVSLGAVGGLIGVTKEAVSGLAGDGAALGQAAANILRPAPAGWDCGCGQKGITSNFCPNCGAKRPETADSWDCECGQKGITSNFCPNCGAKRPEKPEEWDCPACGTKKIVSKFCPNCGAKKPEPAETWDCECGQKGISSNFCPNCGKKREE